MKPAPPKKPRRIRAVLIYTVPEHLYINLKNESDFLDKLLREYNRLVKGDHVELASWGSKKGCRVGNIESNKLNINTSEKISVSKVKRHFDFGAMKGKKSPK